MLRSDAEFGFLAILLLFAIVWTTDVLGYFAGRAFGGPKLMPAVSPKKTWSGAVAGTLGAMIVAVLLAKSFRIVQRRCDCARRFAAVGGGATRRSVRILDQAAIWRQGCKPAHSRSWRRDGSARRLLGGRLGRLPDRSAARRLRWRRRAVCWYGERMTDRSLCRRVSPVETAAGREPAQRHHSWARPVRSAPAPSI